MSEPVAFFIRGKDLLAEPYHYTASGLDNVFLMNGVTITNTSYGPMVSIENINGLHRAIGLHISEKEEPMTGAEFRFLRKQMRLTQTQLAERMSVTDQTIANYEKGNTNLGSAEPLMRTFYMIHILPDQTRMDVLRSIAEEQKKLPDVPRFKVVEGWQENDDVPLAA